MPIARPCRPSPAEYLAGLAAACVGADVALLVSHDPATLAVVLAAAKYPLALAAAPALRSMRRWLRRAEAACLRDLEH